MYVCLDLTNIMLVVVEPVVQHYLLDGHVGALLFGAVPLAQHRRPQRRYRQVEEFTGIDHDEEVLDEFNKG